MYSVSFLLKRVCDLWLAMLLIILTSPFLIIIALLIKLDSIGPVFYKQERMGLNNQIFTIYKFRTMVVNADEIYNDLVGLNEMKDGILFKLKEDPRVTKIGKFLRISSLDELPQLFNVLLGDMSFVGPRPFALRDVEKIPKQHYIRHSVMPGITGLWQVSGRSNITDFQQVILLDTLYINTWSLFLDFKILLKTIVVVLKKTGAY